LVIPEIDTPGHAKCWAKSYPDLFPTTCNSENYVLDVTQPSVYEFVKNIFKEVALDLFPNSPFLHLGGDEVDFACWQSDPDIKIWMQENHISNYSFLQGYYEQNVQDIVVNELDRDPIFWEEVYDLNAVKMNPRTIVHLWKNNATWTTKVAKAGHRVIYSTSYYLDRQVPDPTDVYYFWQDTWKNFYKQDPIIGHLTPSELNYVLGAEACMWGEQVDWTVLDTRIWPRACGAAERFWSPKTITNEASATARIKIHRCRMVNRGIRAGPITPDFCFIPGEF